MNYLYVFIGAGLGGGLRYYLSNVISKAFPVLFPFGTLAVNFLGSFILGFLLFGFDEKQLLSQKVKLLLGTGFCGGLTTFSTFSYETFYLFKETQYQFAFANIALNMVLTLAGVYLGFLLSRS
jgi:fluoride exporter